MLSKYAVRYTLKDMLDSYTSEDNKIIRLIDSKKWRDERTNIEVF